jgi:hypothetical protein
MNVEVKRLCITSFGMVGIYSSFDTKKLLFKMNANKKKRYYITNGTKS